MQFTFSLKITRNISMAFHDDGRRQHSIDSYSLRVTLNYASQASTIA
jgi:hypothetical protein